MLLLSLPAGKILITGFEYILDKNGTLQDQLEVAHFLAEAQTWIAYKSEKENVDEDIYRIGNGVFAVEVDLMMPIDPNKSPKVHDPKLNHIGLWIDDLQACVKWLTEQGVRFTPGGIRKGAGGFDVCFIHPKGNEEFPLCSEGVLVELVQAPEDVITALR